MSHYCNDVSLPWRHNEHDASQINTISIVYWAICSGAGQRKHQNSASLAFVRGIHQWLVNSPHKRPVIRKMFPFDDIVMWCLASISHSLITKPIHSNQRRPLPIDLLWDLDTCSMEINRNWEEEGIPQGSVLRLYLDVPDLIDIQKWQKNILSWHSVKTIYFSVISFVNTLISLSLLLSDVVWSI